jgi:hypothetical protein
MPHLPGALGGHPGDYRPSFWHDRIVMLPWPLSLAAGSSAAPRLQPGPRRSPTDLDAQPDGILSLTRAGA